MAEWKSTIYFAVSKHIGNSKTYYLCHNHGKIWTDKNSESLFPNRKNNRDLHNEPYTMFWNCLHQGILYRNLKDASEITILQTWNFLWTIFICRNLKCAYSFPWFRKWLLRNERNRFALSVFILISIITLGLVLIYNFWWIYQSFFTFLQFHIGAFKIIVDTEIFIYILYEWNWNIAVDILEGPVT